jgi:hypothetical protein
LSHQLFNAPVPACTLTSPRFSEFPRAREIPVFISLFKKEGNWVLSDLYSILSHPAHNELIFILLPFSGMISSTHFMEKPMVNENQKIVRIRQKIKEIFDCDCSMNDQMLMKRYAITDNGELIIFVK